MAHLSYRQCCHTCLRLVLQNESHKLASLRESCHTFWVYVMWDPNVACLRCGLNQTSTQVCQTCLTLGVATLGKLSLKPNNPKISIKKTTAHLKRPNPNKHELELNSNIWKYCSVKNFSRKKSWVIFGDCFHTHKKVRWMSFERDTVTHHSIDRTAAVHALAEDSVSWLSY